MCVYTHICIAYMFVHPYLQGARGNDCDVWIAPEIPDSPEDLVGERGEITSKVFLDLRILTDYNKEVLEDGAVRVSHTYTCLHAHNTTTHMHTRTRTHTNMHPHTCTPTHT